MKLYRIHAAAEQIGVSDSTLRRWCRAGLAPYLKSQMGSWFWSEEMIDEIKQAMEVESDGEAEQETRGAVASGR